MSPTVKLLAALALTAAVASANAQYPQPHPTAYAVPMSECVPAVKTHRSWSPFGWLCRPSLNTAPSLKRAEYPLGFPASPYIRSPRDYFMTEQ